MYEYKTKIHSDYDYNVLIYFCLEFVHAIYYISGLSLCLEDRNNFDHNLVFWLSSLLQSLQLCASPVTCAPAKSESSGSHINCRFPGNHWRQYHPGDIVSSFICFVLILQAYFLVHLAIYVFFHLFFSVI